MSPFINYNPRNRSAFSYVTPHFPPGSVIAGDTNAIVHGNIEGFFKYTVPELKKNGIDIVFSKSSMDETARLAHSGDGATARKAAKAWNLVIASQKAGLCQICGDEDDASHADQVFLYVVLKYCRRHPFYVMTFDKDLCDDLELINHLKSTRCKNPVKSLCLMPDGTLKERKYHA